LNAGSSTVRVSRMEKCLYARARLNGNLELSRRINIVRHSHDEQKSLRCMRSHGCVRVFLPVRPCDRVGHAATFPRTRADPDESRTFCPFRLRVRAQRDRQPLHDVCSARRLAPCQALPRYMRRSGIATARKKPSVVKAAIERNAARNASAMSA
jgi:hypothetical protein